jgi:hypothetical protein
MKRYFLLILVCYTKIVLAQDELMNLLNEETAKEKRPVNYAIATFKSSRIINSHSIESPAKGVLDVIIHHRFGRVNSGWREMFGLDNANIRLGVEYGFTDWLAAGIGRSRNEKIFDGFIKIKALRQSKGNINMPVSVNWISDAGVTTLKALPGREKEMNFVRRLNFCHQLLIARKFHEYFSLQIMPSWIHRNLVPKRTDDNDVFAIGAGATVKISRSVRITGEYHYVLSHNTATQYRNPVSIGVDLETGGHVFQFMLSNSIDMIDNLIIPKTNGSWRNGDIHFGFNIHRVFTIVDYQKRTAQKIEKSGVK